MIRSSSVSVSVNSLHAHFLCCIIELTIMLWYANNSHSLSVCLSVYLSVCLFVCLSVCLSLSFSLSPLLNHIYICSFTMQSLRAFGGAI